MPNEKNKIYLTFKSTINKKPLLKIPSQFIIEIKKLSQLNQNIIIFKNIDDIIKIEQETSQIMFNNYYILLLKLKEKNEGFLIGNVKKIGDILIGTWPFNKQQEQASINNINEKFNNILKNPKDYTGICLIN